MWELLRERLEGLGISCPPGLTEKLELHWRLTQAAGREFNLTAIRDRAEAIDKHYIDSLLALPVLAKLPPPGGAPPRAADSAPLRAADIGSGAGFPSLPLALARPDISWTLLEATAKKAAFLERAAQELGLEQGRVRVLALRAEQAGHEPSLRARFDLATARAVAPLAVLAEYALPLLKSGGFLLAYKGPEAAAELREAERALLLLGGAARPELSGTLSLPYGRRELVVIEKAGRTPDKYPRRAGMPAKRPL